MTIVVPFIGGEWHGSAYEARGLLKTVLTDVGMPPRYLGNGQYDAFVSHLGHETYHLREFEGKKYYVSESWLVDFPANIDTPHETANSRRMREEVEKTKRGQMQTQIDLYKTRLLRLCIEKHMALDDDGEAHEKEIQERETWVILNEVQIDLLTYKGEPSMTQERYKPK